MISFEVNQSVGEPIADRFWRTWLTRLSTVMKLKGKRTVSIALVDGRTIRKLNRMYRGKDKVTDVLSFAQADGDDAPGELKSSLGEIIICYPQAVRQARALGHNLERELAVLLVHSCLHLLGYEHHKTAAADIMKRWEHKVLDH